MSEVYPSGLKVDFSFAKRDLRKQSYAIAVDYRDTFRHKGLHEFEEIWRLPHHFVEDPNHRRGGWSAASRLLLGPAGKPLEVYLKRQENQLRQSFSRPFGELTFFNEVRAIRRNQALGLPNVELIAYGFRKQDGNRQGFLVTRSLETRPLTDFRHSGIVWADLAPVLRETGKQLYRMHANRISHGALYPKHLFIDPVTRQVNLIDFERSRICPTVSAALSRDLKQLLRRVNWLPSRYLEILLSSHLANRPAVTEKLLEKYYAYRSSPFRAAGNT